MEPRTEQDARTSLATWLREGRTRKQLSIEEVSRITKIQLRILERLESGQYEGLPAEVFVKGFVRSFAKCVGLDESEAVERYGAATQGQPAQAMVVAQAMVETLVPITQRKIDLFAPGPVEYDPTEPPVREAPLIEARLLSSVETPKQPDQPEQRADANEAPEIPKKKRSRKKHTNPAPRSRRKKQTQEPVEIVATESIETVVTTTESIETVVTATKSIENVVTAIDTAPVASILALGDAESIEATVEAKSDPSPNTSGAPEDGAVEEPALAEGSQRISQQSIEVEVCKQLESESPADEVAGTWQPTMPPISMAPSVPWRRPISWPKQAAYVVPSLIIDDADPDSADREREERAAKEPNRLSFLPPILLDREDRSARQGGLTLAVIILLIAATLTLSYLMRRPSASGDGVTMVPIRSGPVMLG